MRLQVIAEHINDEMHKLHDINAFRSSLIEDCIGRACPSSKALHLLR